jgi:lipoprotein-anchoring transpeptidase ErfK/SrfK
MSKYRVFSLLLMSAASSALASAATADPMVVRGIYPKVQQPAQPQQAYNQPAGAQDQNAPQMQAQTSSPSGAFGGGFLEMLLTGHAASGPQSDAQPGHERDMTALAGPMAPASAVNPGPGAQHEVDPMFHRQEVDYTGSQKPGTIVIDTKDKFLFLVEKSGKAMRYGIGVGREGFLWTGTEKISRKAEWPDWTPPPDMLKRRPDLPTHMDGGPENPLGARALYLGASLYRIHGTNEPNTIGTNVSSGCIRMMNEDVEDLYNRVGVGTTVVVM